MGDNLYSNSVVALDADTGTLRWHYQFTPHDERDWDSAQTPALADLEWEGRARKVILWANRNGFLYVLDRATGEFLRATPFVEVNWAKGFDNKGRPMRTAPSVGIAASPVMPGSAATNWFPPSYSALTGFLHIPVWERLAGERGNPVQGKAFGAVRAFDPVSGQRKWEFRVDDAVFHSGVLTTASGLVFAGTWGDFYSEPQAARLADGFFYALDGRTGQQLWKMSLGGSVHGSPMSYAVNGEQYVAVAAGNTLFSLRVRK
jgi:alcohol dehydrogenase (cytochrome c)